ncbi:unnamed protein product [Lactuca saligna]|uniref:GTD-binding domain-containing protein n=1 Tax=Lactuca saligna TaxID=75948 RepID=A0AA35ZQP2_LACSI|nr:unnamed protein product [Lactuca saligna]
MAANKFATMVHNNTNKITLVLIYAVLEWILIILLLLNSIFSYLIIKFAQFFGLKPPCLWCVRLECFFEPQNKNSHRDLLCELHAKEVSQLGFCSNHRKLAESHDMCEDCSSGFREKSRSFMFSKVKQIDLVQSDGEEKVRLKCSCCGVDFERKSFDDSSYFVINPSWDFLGFSKKGSSIMDLIGSDLETDNFGEKQEIQIQMKETEATEIESIKDDLIQFEKKDDSNSETPAQDLEFFLDYSGHQLVPIESIDATTVEFRNNSEVHEDHEFGDFQKAQATSESTMETVTQELVKATDETLSVLQNSKELESSKLAELDSMEFEETENSLVFHANLSAFSNEKPAMSEDNQTPFDSEELKQTEENHSDNEEAEVSIGTEIPVLDSCDEIKAQDNFTLYSSSHEEPSTSSHDLDFNLEYGFDEAREEEKTWELTTTMESVSEMDNGDPINTTEKLKSALRAERKALQALYTELEEERSASAVAASETMAMINRLQEEKAAMQMEALQYQRMMEEQSEYDQEALQLLNDLMMKKEKELESCRKKVSEYEAKERMRFLASSVKSGTCSASCSHSEDGDGMWVDVNSDSKEDNGNHENRNRNTPVETVLNLDSFVEFEDERLSILEQLKVLEEKLFTLSDEEDRHFNDIGQIEDYFEENGKHINGNGITNVFPMESHYQDRRSDGLTGKRLLPLFDALDTESDDGVITSNGNGNGFHSDKIENTAVTRFELQKKRIDIEEEVDQLYVRFYKVKNGAMA